MNDRLEMRDALDGNSQKRPAVQVGYQTSRADKPALPPLGKGRLLYSLYDYLGRTASDTISNFLNFLNQLCACRLGRFTA